MSLVCTHHTVSPAGRSCGLSRPDPATDLRSGVRRVSLLPEVHPALISAHENPVACAVLFSVFLKSFSIFELYFPQYMEDLTMFEVYKLHS